MNGGAAPPPVANHPQATGRTGPNLANPRTTGANNNAAMTAGMTATTGGPAAPVTPLIGTGRSESKNGRAKIGGPLADPFPPTEEMGADGALSDPRTVTGRGERANGSVMSD
jgi:hypothetical protein